jgi:hypothetical protein
MDMREQITDWLGEGDDAIGFAPASRPDAREEHHSSQIRKNIEVDIALGRTVARGMLRSGGIR